LGKIQKILLSLSVNKRTSHWPKSPDFFFLTEAQNETRGPEMDRYSLRMHIHTSTISTEPACSKNPASWALSTLNGRLPTNNLSSSENFSPPSCPSASTSSASSSDATAARTGTSALQLDTETESARSCGRPGGKEAAAGLAERERN
jgi:hypothetical protein